IAHDGWQSVTRCDLRADVGSDEVQLDHPARVGLLFSLSRRREGRLRQKTRSDRLAVLPPAQRKRDPLLGEVEGFVAALNVEGHSVIEPPAVLDEVERHLAHSPEPKTLFSLTE